MKVIYYNNFILKIWQNCLEIFGKGGPLMGITGGDNDEDSFICIYRDEGELLERC